MKQQPKSGSLKKKSGQVRQLRPSGNGVASQGAVTIDQRVAACEVNIRNLHMAAEHNTKIFQDTNRAVDTMIQVLQRVFNDMLSNDLRKNDDGTVDFRSYIAEFYGCYGFLIFIELWKRDMEASLSTETHESEDQEPVVFGGESMKSLEASP